MEYLIVAFRSRAHTIKFANLLHSQNIAMEIVNTPKEAGVGCGVSVKVRKQNYDIVKRLVVLSALSSFAGFFSVKELGEKRLVRTV